MKKADYEQAVDERFDLREIRLVAEKLWDGRLVIVLTTILSTLLAIIYLHTTPYTYTTSMTLIPTQPQQQDIAGQFGGLAAMAGINIPNVGASSVSPFSVYPETAQTRQVASKMIQTWPEVMPALFRDQWDPDTKTWHASRTLRRNIIDFVKPLFGIPVYGWHAPGPGELQQYIGSSVVIVPDKKKPLLTITMQAQDPNFSRKFILVLHQSVDAVLRRMTLDRAKKYASYLENKLTTTQTSVVRDVLTQSLSDQETLVMMGNSDTDFAAQPLGPPESSIRATKPVPIFVLLFGVLAGILAGSACVVFDIEVFEIARRLSGMAPTRNRGKSTKREDLSCIPKT